MTSCAATSPANSASHAPTATLNVRRIGFVASEITKNGGVAICAPIAPDTDTRPRRAVRKLIPEPGAFIEIHVATPPEVCEAHNRSPPIRHAPFNVAWIERSGI